MPMAATWARRASGGSAARTVPSQRRRRVGRTITVLPLLTPTAGRIHSVPHVLARLFLVEEGIAATVARDRLRFTLAVRVS